MLSNDGKRKRRPEVKGKERNSEKRKEKKFLDKFTILNCKAQTSILARHQSALTTTLSIVHSFLARFKETATPKTNRSFEKRQECLI